jgi:hypothetical protein
MAINRDVNVKIRANLLLTELRDEDDPAGRGGGRQGTQGHQIIDYASMNVDKHELERRLADAADVLLYGYELTGTQPPIAITEGATAITSTSATVHGHVSPNVNTTCGFLYGTTKELGSTTTAPESPLAGLTDTKVAITGPTGAVLTPNTRYYYRAWAQIAGLHVRYGRIRSFKTLAV